MSRSRKTVKSQEEMFALAALVVNDLKAKSYKLKAALVVGLTGELGAGKTTFVKGVARALGVRETVTSPTFVIMKIYKLPRRRVIDPTSNFLFPTSKPWHHLIHIDAYRLESPEELRALGWDEIAADPGNLILVEWAEKVRPLLRRGYRAISFDVVGENERAVFFEATLSLSAVRL
ncbi:MAG: tRNA (adenosine(37)-N6)-threonylcarbamoyltransferase complex ATPase subunit type 1 TsaE [Patescibacteria group bacterium]|nr:tRNA (adenosine(37)-N6)-threonylcarbamoyltransferase complex ATPase subunit type 1 TsaE [Patescibacteria group bacterium]